MGACIWEGMDESQVKYSRNAAGVLDGCYVRVIKMSVECTEDKVALLCIALMELYF